MLRQREAGVNREADPLERVGEAKVNGWEGRVTGGLQRRLVLREIRYKTRSGSREDGSQEEWRGGWDGPGPDRHAHTRTACPDRTSAKSHFGFGSDGTVIFGNSRTFVFPHKSHCVRHTERQNLPLTALSL